ncbi:MAG: shikimate dehydrogenase [Bacteroidetes bacterium]|nr:shikimate dehydrogenase [Bacteroidota bacterium]
MKKLGLIGNPISHSRSPALFKEFFRKENLHDWSYELFPLNDISELPLLLKKEPELVGINVTAPFKKTVISCLDVLGEEAHITGSVNTITIRHSKKGPFLGGFNTDVYGFEAALNTMGAPLTPALILGNGGAAAAVKCVFNKKNIPFITISRKRLTDCIGYDELSPGMVSDHPLIIQTTVLGMGEYADLAPPIPYNAISPGHFCMDLVYHPEETLFMKKCAEQGAMVMNGLSMLSEQACCAWKIFKETNEQL